MQRRNVLKSIATAAIGVGVSALGQEPHGAPTAKPGVPKTKVHPVSFIQANDGTSLFYRDWGTGPAVVFVAPWGLNSDWWEYQIAYLTGQGLRCIAYDRRGHGRSQEPGYGYDFDTLADDLAAVIQQLDLRGITLVGHSMGAAEVVRYLARHHADRVARAVLVATITPFTLKTADNPEGDRKSTRLNS